MMVHDIFYKLTKRLIDIIISFILIILYTPLFLFCSLLIILETRRFPLIIQKRALSIKSKPINILKFRTLSGDFDTSTYTQPLKRVNLLEKVGSTGKFLRLTGLDELPQLINVFHGNMSLIGPRPLDYRDLELIDKQYPHISENRAKLRVKPGITGLWQTHKDDKLDPEYMYFLDELYTKEKSLLLDFYIIMKTIQLIFTLKHKDGILLDSGKANIFKFSVFSLSFIYFLIVFVVIYFFASFILEGG